MDPVAEYLRDCIPCRYDLCGEHVLAVSFSLECLNAAGCMGVADL